MRHDVVLEGYGCRLRPVTLSDAEFIVTLRNQPFTKGTIHATSTDVDAQKRWIQDYFERSGDYYWIVEAQTEGNWKAVGTLGLYDITAEGHEAMPGRWVMYPQVVFPVVLPEMLLYAFVFERLCLKRLVFDVVASNKKVVRFHRLFGARELGRPPKRYAGTEAEVGAPLVWFELTAEMWTELKAKWLPILEAYAATKEA